MEQTSALDRDEVRAVSVIVCLFACGYATVGLFQHWHFGTSYDLGIFDQAIWHLSRFEAPASSISGFSNILADHFYPVIAVFAPLYWMAPRPETLILSQAFLLAASMAPVYLFLRDRMPRGAALSFSVAYGFFWGIQQTAAFDFHEMAFAPLLIALAILAVDRQNWRMLWTASVLLVFVKEDLIPVLTFLGLHLVLRGQRTRGLLLLVASLAAFGLIVGVLIPALTESGMYTYAGAYTDLLQRPWSIPATLVTPPYKMRTMFYWLVPFVFLSLRSPLSLLLVPLALERFLSASPQHWGTAFHYSAPVAPIVAMSAGDGLARIARQFALPETRLRLFAWVAGVTLILSAVLPGRQPLWRVLSPDLYRETASVGTGYHALALIPEDAPVVAQAAVLPHLSQRRAIHVLRPNAPDAEFVVASASLSPWPATTYDEIATLLVELRRRGYTAIFERDGWTVLHRSPEIPVARSGPQTHGRRSPRGL